MARQLSMTFFGKVIEGICILTILVSRIGAVHSVVFAGFSAESVAQRISDCKPKALITCNVVMRGSKLIRLKQIVDAALTESSKNGFSLGSNPTSFNWSTSRSCALDQFGNKSIMSAASFSAPVAGSSYVGLKPSPPKMFQMKDSVAWNRKTVSNGSKTHCMKTWHPIDNKKFETLSYLPPVTDDSIAREIDYMMKKGWIPCLEFDAVR
ncbi:hypothetical protein AgCh_012010 [Apium graveolens]